MCAEPVAAGAAKCSSCGESLGARRVASKPGGLSLVVILVICAAFLCVGVLVLVAIAIPSTGGARVSGNEARAIGNLRTICTAQVLFREGDKDEDGSLDYAGSLVELSAPGLVDSVLGSGVQQGYTFQVVVAPATPELLWMAVASPVSPGVTGHRYFATNQAGIVYYSKTTPFSITADCSIPQDALPVGR